MAKIRVKNGVLTIPEGTDEIGDMAFFGRNKLVSVFVPDSVCEIGSCAFARCKNLTSISFPKSLSVIKSSAFMGCKSLETITFTSNYIHIYELVFGDCPSIKVINVPKNRGVYYKSMLDPSLHEFVVESDYYTEDEMLKQDPYMMNLCDDEEDDIRKEIESRLTLRGYSVMSKAFWDVDVVVGNNERVYLCSVVSENENVDEVIKNEIKRLRAVKESFENVITDTLEGIEMSVTPVIVSLPMGLSSETEAIMNETDVEYIKYDEHDADFNNVFPIDEDYPYVDDVMKDSFEACVGYIKTVIEYVKKTKDFSNEKFYVKTTNVKGKCKRFSSPRVLAAEVKKYVKGQDEVIDKIAIPFFQHVESMHNERTCSVKSSFIIAGNTGTGKSETLRRFAELCNVPIIRINISECTAYGWKGQSISDFISYYINDESDIEKLKYAVIVFNEFDKITHYNARITSTSGTDGDRDMQRDLLKFYDKGYELMIDKSSGFSCGEKYRIPTENMLLCFDGAFSGIEKIIEKRLDLNPKVGYGTASSQNDNINLMLQLTMEDLEIWGYLPELLGRIGSCYVMNPMTKELAYEIITGASDNILEAHRQQCLQYGIDVEFSDEVLWHISEETVKAKQGFRAAKTILSNMMEKIYFDCDKYSGQKFKIDMNYVSNTK